MSLRHSKSYAGFTLIELSMVVGMLALLLAGIMQVIAQDARRKAATEVKRKMDLIEAELLNFTRLNGRLPCPADATLSIASQYFGVESVAPGNCGTGSTYTAPNYVRTVTASPGPTANFNNGVVVAGDVPVKTLGLPDDYMFDPWGSRFFYVVQFGLTSNNAFTTFPVTSNPGSITIKDGSGVNPPLTAKAILVVLSFGPDGHGAFQYGGGGVRKSANNSNINTLINCHCDNTATATNFAASTFIQAPPTSTSTTDPNSFDDIVRFYTRQSFLSSTDTSSTGR